jgi:hypothetical protein
LDQGGASFSADGTGRRQDEDGWVLHFEYEWRIF